MTQHVEGDPFQAVQALEAELAANPADQDIRHRLALALEAWSVVVRSLTREQALVITSVRQQELCRRIADRILALQTGDPRLTAGAQHLLTEVETGRRWVWHRQPQAALFGVLALVVGLGGAVGGGLAGSIPLIVAAAVVSSLVLVAVVLRYRRVSWRIRAEEVAPLIWRPGI
jgi:hypothetical protein